MLVLPYNPLLAIRTRVGRKRSNHLMASNLMYTQIGWKVSRKADVSTLQA